MQILGKVGAYFIAYSLIIAIELPFLPITMSLIKPLRRFMRFSPLVLGFLSMAKICTAILLAAWLIHTIGQTPSWLMFLIPGYFMVHNNLKRIRLVEAGKSNIKVLLGQNAEPDSCDPTYDLHVEWTYLIGDILGWIIGIKVALHSASFF